MKVFLAGTNCLKNNIIDFKKIDYILESFYTIKDWQIPLIKKCKMFLLDSGAFTFMNSYKGKVDWDKYIERYAKFINDNNIKYFFELDIDSIVGLNEVERLRAKLENLTGKQCIPVWHKSRGLEYWKRMIKEYKYVAIGGFVTKEITKKDYKYIALFLKLAKENNTNVHGLGFTNKNFLKLLPFYSVDSTSWTTGNRYANIYIFTNNKLKTIMDSRRIRELSKRINKNAYCNLSIHNLNEWIKFQKYADKNL